MAKYIRTHAGIADHSASLSRDSWRIALAALASMFVASLVIIVIFRLYSDALSSEFYDLASESMNDYTVSQKIEVESMIREVGTAVSSMRVLAESSDIDPTGPTFTSYLENWNNQNSFQVSYTSIEELEAGVYSSESGKQDLETLQRLQAGETVVSDVRKSNRLNGYFFSIAEPVRKEGQTIGVVRSIVKADALLETSQRSSQVNLLGSMLIKGDGTIVSVTDQTEYSEGQSLYDLVEFKGLTVEQADAVRANVENESDVATIMLGKQDGRMTFFTSVRLNVNDWTIVNFTQEGSLAQRSDNILSATVFAGALLVVISAIACLVVALVINGFRRRVRRSAERYAVLAEFSDIVLFSYSYPRDTLELTPNARTFFSLSSLTSENYLASGVSTIEFHKEDSPFIHALFENPGAPDETRTVSCRARVLSGEYRWFSLACRYLYDGAQPYEAVGKIVDITQQRETEERLILKSQIDGLTNTFNKVTVEEKIGEMLGEYDAGLLFVLDMDKFKQVNDEYGHRVGDRVLEEVSRALFDVFRQRDPIGRIGGDEFVVFLAGTNDEEVANTKREALESLIAEASRILNMPIAVSTGVARYPQDGTTYQELFDAADRAMYERKNETRD